MSAFERANEDYGTLGEASAFESGGRWNVSPQTADSTDFEGDRVPNDAPTYVARTARPALPTLAGRARREEEGWVRAMANGDRGALASLYAAYAPLMMGVARRILRDRREAEDLIHDVFLEAWRHAEDYDPSRGCVRAWLLIRLRSRALDRVRSAGVAPFVAFDVEQTARAVSDHDPSDCVDHARLRCALATLSRDQRAVLDLGYFEGLSSTEIAVRVDAPVGTVKSRLAKALTNLRSALLDGDDEPTDASARSMASGLTEARLA